MPVILYGDRIARSGQLRLGCSVAIFDETGRALLLTRRADNDEWCLPGGGVSAGENVEEAIVRETIEETGLEVEVAGLVGVYSDPHCIVVYPDGNQYHLVALSFAARVRSGTLRTSTSETVDARFVSAKEIQEFNIISIHYQRVIDSFAFNGLTFIR